MAVPHCTVPERSSLLKQITTGALSWARAACPLWHRAATLPCAAAPAYPVPLFSGDSCVCASHTVQWHVLMREAGNDKILAEICDWILARAGA